MAQFHRSLLFAFVTLVCAYIAAASNDQRTPANIAFDLPDLIVIGDAVGRTVQLEAFRSTANDGILNEHNSAEYGRLFWVSIGSPKFIRSGVPGTNQSAIFHKSRDGFYAQIQMLTEDQRQLFASAVRQKYNITVSINQVVNLILSTFECSLTEHDRNRNKYLLKGAVKNFHEFPLAMTFPAREDNEDYTLFSRLLHEADRNGSNLDFHCYLATVGKEVRSNRLSINLKSQQRIGLEEKLFGNADSSSAYVTRKQMTELSNEMYSSLDIVEEYEMSEFQFNEAFIGDFIKQVT